MLIHYLMKTKLKSLLSGEMEKQENQKMTEKLLLSIIFLFINAGIVLAYFNKFSYWLGGSIVVLGLIMAWLGACIALSGRF